MNPVWVFIALGEKPGLLALAGAIVIIAAVLSLNISGKKKDPRRTEISLPVLEEEKIN